MTTTTGLTPTQLIAFARRGLDDAHQTWAPPLRYATAHHAATRAACAVVAAHGIRDNRRPVWDLLADAAPHFTDWARHFADTNTRRAACEAGIPRVVAANDADDMFRAAEQFVAVAEQAVTR